EHRGGDFGRGTAADEALVEADSDSADPAPERSTVILYWLATRCWIRRVVAGDHPEHRRGIGDRAGHRPDMVQRLAEGENTSAAHARVSWFQADDAAGCRGEADRAARVGAERSEAETRSRGYP